MKWILHEVDTIWSGYYMKWILHEVNTTCSGYYMKWIIHEVNTTWGGYYMKWILHEVNITWSEYYMKWILHEVNTTWSRYYMKRILHEVDTTWRIVGLKLKVATMLRIGDTSGSYLASETSCPNLKSSWIYLDPTHTFSKFRMLIMLSFDAAWPTVSVFKWIIINEFLKKSNLIGNGCVCILFFV